MRYDPYVYARFIQRMTSEDRARLTALDASHFLLVCPFVEAMRDAPRPPGWFDTQPFTVERDPRRYSAKFAHEPGLQSVAGGGVVRSDGAMQSWFAVQGEFEARSAPQQAEAA